MSSPAGRPQQRRLPPLDDPDDTDSEIELAPPRMRHIRDEEDESEDRGDELVAAEDGEEEFEEEDGLDPDPSNAPVLNLDPPPSYLREISTLASWTVSSSKPGCSIPQLRHPSTTLFWQSDGPQPHYLNIHFFKLVRIVGLRLYLDFEQDESYTPTRIIFLAGSGMNDLQEWGEMKLESPRGWVWADFSGVGDPDSDSEDEDEDDEPRPTTAGPSRTNGNEASSDSENNAPPPPAHAPLPPEDAMQLDPQTQPIAPLTQPIAPLTFTSAATPTNLHHTSTPTLARPTPRLPFAALSPNTAPLPAPGRRRTPKMPVLRAHLVQIKILENHQNGKDTHLRGLQIFARNDEELSRAAGGRNGAVKTFMGEEGEVTMTGAGGEKVVRRMQRLDLGPGSRSAWDVEPGIR